MFSTHRRILILAGTILVLNSGQFVMGQSDPFPNVIPKGMRVGITDFAVVPDSSGVPARMTEMTRDPLGRLFVNDQRGLIHSISSDGSVVTPYIDIKTFSGVVLTASGERGLQSVAFHPDFSTSGADGFGKFYTIHSSWNISPTPDFSVSTTNPFHSVVMEWTTNDPSASTYAAGGNNAPREILRIAQPDYSHNGGQLAFNTSSDPGTDRNNLYISMGDGAANGDPFENGQNTDNPFGAILRIDPLGNNSANGKYGIVAENVFAADGDSNTLGEIYAYGLRNPQRYAWDSLTGKMFIADIGQEVIEEINLGVNGGNFGWDEREGSLEFEGPMTVGMINPVFEYDHTNVVLNSPIPGSERAITVGDVARGTGIAGLDGNLMLGDFPTGLIFYANVDSDPLDGGQDGLYEMVLIDNNGQEVRLMDLINATRANRGLAAVNRADLRFSYGINGEVYILNKQDGVIRRLVTAVPEPANAAIAAMASILFLLNRNRRSISCRTRIR